MQSHNIHYNNLLTKSGPVKFSDYINENHDKIHAQLYNNALNKFLAKNNISKLDYNIIEVKGDFYYNPSSIVIREKVPPFKYFKDTKKWSLKEYWNIEYIDSLQRNIENLLWDEENENYNDAKVVYIDYVKGECLMYSKMSDVYFKLPFNYIHSNTGVDKRYLDTNDTFTNLIREKRLK